MPVLLLVVNRTAFAGHSMAGLKEELRLRQYDVILLSAVYEGEPLQVINLGDVPQSTVEDVKRIVREIKG